MGKNKLGSFPAAEVVDLVSLQSLNICHNHALSEKLESLQFNSDLTDLNMRGLVLDLFMKSKKEIDEIMQSSRLRLLASTFTRSERRLSAAPSPVPSKLTRESRSFQFKLRGFSNLFALQRYEFGTEKAKLAKRRERRLGALVAILAKIEQLKSLGFDEMQSHSHSL